MGLSGQFFDFFKIMTLGVVQVARFYTDFEFKIKIIFSVKFWFEIYPYVMRLKIISSRIADVPKMELFRKIEL